MSDSREITIKRAMQIASLTDNFEDWFRTWADTHRLTISYRGSYTIEGEPIKEKVLRAMIYQHAKRVSRKYNYPDIDAELELRRAEARKAYWEKMIGKLKLFEPDPRIMPRFVKAIVGYENPEVIAVFRHFVWQVKRKLLGLEVERHMMPVLFGRQDGGKSTAVRKLCETLGELCIGKTMDSLSKEAEWSMFEDFGIIVLDEMAKAEKTCLQTLKKVITDHELSYRGFFTHTQITHPNRATMIGTTNKPLDEVILDTSGIRRFYQVDALDQMDWNTINEIDYEKLWASVDPNEPCPVNVAYRDIKIRQEETRAKSQIEYFIEEIELVRTREFKASTDVLYLAYETWCEKSGMRKFDKNYFGRQLSSLRIERTQCGSKTKRLRGFYCFAPDLRLEPSDEKEEAQ